MTSPTTSTVTVTLRGDSIRVSGRPVGTLTRSYAQGVSYVATATASGRTVHASGSKIDAARALARAMGYPVAR